MAVSGKLAPVDPSPPGRLWSTDTSAAVRACTEPPSADEPAEGHRVGGAGRGERLAGGGPAGVGFRPGEEGRRGLWCPTAKPPALTPTRRASTPAATRPSGSGGPWPRSRCLPLAEIGGPAEGDFREEPVAGAGAGLRGGRVRHRRGKPLGPNGESDSNYSI